MKFGVENPGYRKITKIYDENGVNWDYVNIDDKGMKVDELRMKDINVAHVSPEHHSLRLQEALLFLRIRM